MKTAHKIAIARACYRGVYAVRRAVGLNERTAVKRNGIRFALDLSEGIDLAIYLRNYEPHTAKALARNISIGSHVIDIGANIGAHTLHMAKLVGKTGTVFAFEPTEFAFRKLLHNLHLNPALNGRIVPFQTFLSKKNGACLHEEIYSSWPLNGGERLHSKHLGQPKGTSGATSRTLDSVVVEHGMPRIALIKLDVDGFECEVLEGASAIMRRDRPTFIMELAPYVLEERGASLDRLLSFFLPLGYQFFDERTDRPIAAITGSMIRDGESWNVIARVRTHENMNSDSELH